jgi:type II secretory pathway predicted ATPase ExeA
MVNKYFSLREDPFSVTSDARYFFGSEGHEEALAHLLFGLNNRKGFIALSGEVGAGKTTLLNALLDQLDPTWRHAFIYNSRIDFLEFLIFVLHDLGVKDVGSTKIDCIRQLNEYLIDATEQNLDVVIIIDEAQNLSKDVLEEIRLLSNLATYHKRLLQIIFSGQPEFDQLLNSSELQQLNQRVAIRYFLGALKPIETQEYIYHRLRVAGATDNGIFTQAAIKLIYRSTRGIPRLINQVCSVSMLQAALAAKKRIDESVVKQVLETEFSNHSEINGALKINVDSKFFNLRNAVFGLSAIVVALLIVIVLDVGQIFMSSNPQTSDPEKTISKVDKTTSKLANDKAVDIRNDQIVQFRGESGLGEPKSNQSVNKGDIQSEVDSGSLIEQVLPSPGSSLKESEVDLVLVRSGDSISSILVNKYGVSNDDLIELVMKLNPKIENANLIQRGIILRIPKL